MRDQLKTLDGQPVRVLHPGFWNREAGPDFRGAVVQIGSGGPRHGDLEIDLHPRLWKGHHHDQNPSYRNVILHVVWDGDRSGSSVLPVLPLKSVLDSPLTDLKAWLDQTSTQNWLTLLSGKCAAPLREVPASLAGQILNQAARVRLRAKAAQMQARAQQAGWEQALWEGLFGTLGYKHNVWPMRRLAELRTAFGSVETGSSSVLVWQARLLGLAGLLPAQLTGTRCHADRYLRQLWDIWWREREEYSDVILPEVVWRLSGLRPANRPQRRLALAAHWLASGDLSARLERWFATAMPDRDLPSSLLEVLQARRDDFWSWHWTFRSARLPQPRPLLGAQRVTDLAVNVILPWFWVRAEAGKNEALQQLADRRYFVWPKAEDNALLRMARQRLFGGERVCWLNTAAGQQGLLQIVRDFCDHSNALCEHCQFPELVREAKKLEN
ncbi:MAG: DUF2851 family protein [Verrucomicrobia bacterium]|nr:DUF2851 family protein [Verrucomicrobiota bacterium]